MGLRGHPSLPFLTAAIAALLLYRGMISLAGLDNGAIFAVSVGAAALVAAAWLMAHLVWPLRRE
jgi:hypothetical protein